MAMGLQETDFLIVGGGVIGLAVARELAERCHGAGIVILEKEKEPALHASGRNSGVVHAGFYYGADSLKARFTRDGNRALTDYCLRHGLPINRCGKVVVASSAEEVAGIHELKRRGDANGVELTLVDNKQLRDLEPNARTLERALFSPTTAAVDPRRVCAHLARNLPRTAQILTGCRFIGIDRGLALTELGRIRFRHLFNCAGLYADRVAHCFGVGRRYTMLPFKGIYLRHQDDHLIRRHIYPVPNLNNPFLGVHFTVTVDHHVKIGPTAIPAFWRENYDFLERFDLGELLEIGALQAGLLARNDFRFRALAFQEIRKYQRSRFIRGAARLVKRLPVKRFGAFTAPGIRAQLLDLTSHRLVMDFLVAAGERSTHVLNSVSPAFTSSFPFASHIVDQAGIECGPNAVAAPEAPANGPGSGGDACPGSRP